MQTLAPYPRGWRSYFGFCETPEVLIQITRWVRRRLRVALCGTVENITPSPGSLLQLGVREQLAVNTASSGRCPWYLARSQALHFALSNAYFRSLGLPPLVEGC